MKRMLLFVIVITLVASNADLDEAVESVETNSENSFKISEEDAVQRLEQSLSMIDPVTRGKRLSVKESVEEYIWI